MRAIVGREGLDRPAASTSQMGRFETERLASEAKLGALTELSGAWIDRVHEQWSLTTLREKLLKIGARIVCHGRYLVFQLAEIAVPRALFAEILRRIGRLRGSPMSAT